MKTFLILCLLSLGLSEETTVVKPSFPGGQEVLNKFIQHHMVYPEEAIEEEIEIKAKVILQLDQQGNVDGLRFPEQVAPIFKESILKMVGDMPNWIPAKVNGTPIHSSVNLLIEFELED